MVNMMSESLLCKITHGISIWSISRDAHIKFDMLKGWPISFLSQELHSAHDKRPTFNQTSQIKSNLEYAVNGLL